MNVTPEFSAVVKLDDIGAGAVHHDIAADAAQCAALALRFDLISLDALSASLDISRSADGVRAQGSLLAQVVQACIATGEAVPAIIEEAMDILFITEPDEAGEVELAEDECETMFHDGKGVDLGEAAAQTMGLALNPYPRSNDADTALKAAGVKSEEEEQIASGPFAALSALKSKE
jgi:uncharacterized metal-binding protein YceD (DUF177 family)